MEILLYVLIGLFVLDIILGIVCGCLEGKREALNDYKLSCLLEAVEKLMDDSVFPEFKDGGRK